LTGTGQRFSAGPIVLRAQDEGEARQIPETAQLAGYELRGTARRSPVTAFGGTFRPHDRLG
jgi:hypothetical protein